jgi:iron complex outermembrane receptor protein
VRESPLQHDSRRRCAWLVIVTFGLTLGLGGSASAQTPAGTVRVEVYSTVLPVEGADVSASGVSGTTNASGFATLMVPSGAVSVTARKDGYEPATAPIDIVAGGSRTLRLVLIPSVPDAGTLVASTRTRRSLDDQATPVTLLGRGDIEVGLLKAPGDATTLFDAVPGVRTQVTSPLLGLTGVRIRGLPSHYTRLLSDGVPLYFDRPSGHALLRISPIDLGQIEIIKEPASALFGPDALGVVNLLSRRPGTTPSREILLNQSARGGTDALFWMASPPTGSWSSSWLAGVHRQEETDVDDDGWSDLPWYERAVAGSRVFWNNGRGRMVDGVANVTFEKREGGSATVRESLETRTADGSLSGQMILRNGMVLGGAGMLFVQSRDRRFSDVREPDRLQTATLELTLRRRSSRHTWLAGIAADWYALRRTDQPLPTTYVSTRPGIFFHDDVNVASWLRLSGMARIDHHNLYGFQVSPRGSARIGRGAWTARFSAGQGYFTPRPLMEETEAAGLTRLTIVEPLVEETARSVSADITHRTRTAAVTVAVFRTQIDDPAQIDRETYTLRTETDPIVSSGVELSGTLRISVAAITGSYTHLRTRERGGQTLALTPRHSASLIATARTIDGDRIGFEVTYTGEQRLDANPYRTTSEPYVIVNLFGEYQIGRWRLFLDAGNLTDVRQTDWDPFVRPTRDVDGRWTVDAWAPRSGRVINAGLRILF